MESHKYMDRVPFQERTMKTFLEYIGESSKKDQEAEEARRDGYDAGWEFHLGSGKRAENPHDMDKHPHKYHAWEEGFGRAGEDS